MTRTLIMAVALLAAIGCRGQMSNREARIAYVMANLNLDRAQQKKLSPLLDGYLTDKKTANEGYTSLKAKYKAQIETEKLTEAQAQKLLDAKWEAETKETAVKKKYTAKFRTMLTAAQVYKCFDLLNDKKSRVQGKGKKDDE